MIYTLSITILVALILMVLFILDRKTNTKGVSIRMRSPTLLLITYNLKRFRGEIEIVKSAKTHTPKIDPTLKGWRVMVPLSYNETDLRYYLEKAYVPDYMQSSRREALEVIKLIFRVTRWDDCAFAEHCTDHEKDMLTTHTRDFRHNTSNFLSRTPDVGLEYSVS